MAFSNPIVAGLKLLINAIQSPNYAAGSAGWTINKDGSAEFNNLTIRGTFLGTDFEITSSGIFFYSGTPATGNLVISLAFVGGTDPYSNGYPAGLQILNHGGTGASGIAISYAGTQPLMYFLSALTSLVNDPAFLVNIMGGTGTSQYASFVISGGKDSTQDDYIAISLDASNAAGTHVPTIGMTYVDASSGVHTPLSVSLAGAAVTGNAVAVQPGTGGSRSSIFQPETWHPAASLLGTSWTTSGASNPLRFRLEPQGSGGGCVRLDGEVLTTAAVAANGTIFMLPTGYHPGQGHPFVTRSDIAVAAGGETVNVLTSGSVQNGQAFTASGQRLFFDGIVFPLD